MNTSEWRPIETAPRDGTVIDLWIVGTDDTVDFYAPTAKKVPGKPFRHGRAVNFAWGTRRPNTPNWYPKGGLAYPLSPDVTVTHWMPIPNAPGISAGKPRRSPMTNTSRNGTGKRKVCDDNC